MLDKEREGIVVELCRKLIREQSYSGEEKGVAEILGDNMKAMGFDEVKMDRYGSIVGCIKGKKPGKKILFDGHIDTVPVTDPAKWIHPPFEAEIADGKIYGRGSSDMKGAVAAMTCAAANYAEDTHKDFAATAPFISLDPRP